VIDTLLGYKRIFPRVQKRLEEQDTLAGKIAILEEVLPTLSSSMCRIDDVGPADGITQPLLFTAGLRAGSHFASYAHNVQTFDWDDFYHTYSGHAYFEWMRRQLLSLADVVLIDSRTGLNEMSGVCAQQLADVVVSFCAPNLQNLAGVVAMAKSFTRDELVADRGGRRIDMLIVPTRIDSFNPKRLNEFEKSFRERTDPFTPAILKTLKTDLWSLQLPYAPAHAYRECIVIGDLDADKKLEEAYKRLTVYLAMLAPAQTVLRRRLGDEIKRVIGDVLPRVVIVSGQDSDPVSEIIRAAIEAANIKVWPIPPRTAPAERRAAIAGILEQARVLVVPATPKALQSAEVRDAWRRARQLGVRALPVLDTEPAPDLLDGVPGWMRAVPVLSLDHDWHEILAALNKPAPVTRVPMMAPEPGNDHVRRPHELSLLKSLLLAESPSSTRVALYGPPGSGKSTLAKEFANDDEVQSFFTGGILWVNAYQGANPHEELSKIYLALTGEVATFTNSAETWSALQPRLTAAQYLVVLDDLERLDRLRDFGWVNSCRYLITTRDRRVASMAEATPIELGPADADLARAILAQSGGLTAEAIENVIGAVGTLPLALRIASANVAASSGSTDPRLSLSNLVNQSQDAQKGQFIALLERLEPIERERAAELALNVGDAPVTLEAVRRAWQVDTAEARQTLTRLADLALVSLSNDGQTIELHPYARQLIASAMPASDLNRVLDAAFARIPAADAERARRAICRLIRVNELADFEPRTIRVSELPRDQVSVLEALQAEEIVTLLGETAGDRTVALARAGACRHWQRLRSWVEGDRDFLGWRQRLGAYVSNRQRATDEGSLLGGKLLAEATKWQNERPDDLSEAEHAYINASRAAARKQRQSLVAGAAIALAIVAGSAYSVYRTAATTPPPQGTITLPSTGEDRDVAQGDLSASRGDYAAAIRSYTAALGRQGKNADILYKRGLAYSHSAADADRAMDDFNEALALAPNRADVRAARGAAWLAKNKPREALADLDAAIAGDQKNAQAYGSRAAARAATGDPKGAIADYTMALQLAPAASSTYFARADLYQAAGDTKAAVADFQQVIKLSTDLLEVRAAQARFDQLAGQKTVPNRQTTAYVHYQSPADLKIADDVVRALTSRGFRAEKPQRVSPDQPTAGDVRFLPQDRSAALAITEAVQDALADLGYRLRLKPIAFASDRTPAPRPGRVEVWLPPLAAPSYKR
jgi:tetratricopeptide (TPR) repeat protein